FDGGGTASGNITAHFYNPNQAVRGNAGFGFGRMDSFTRVDVGFGTCGPGCDDVTPLFSNVYAAAGNGCPDAATCVGRITLADPTTNYLITTNTAQVGATTKFHLAYGVRPHTDLDTATPGTPITATNQALDNVTKVQRYLVQTTAGNGITAVSSPNAA